MDVGVGVGVLVIVGVGVGVGVSGKTLIKSKQTPLTKIL